MKQVLCGQLDSTVRFASLFVSWFRYSTFASGPSLGSEAEATDGHASFLVADSYGHRQQQQQRQRNTKILRKYNLIEERTDRMWHVQYRTQGGARWECGMWWLVGYFIHKRDSSPFTLPPHSHTFSLSLSLSLSICLSVLHALQFRI